MSEKLEFDLDKAFKKPTKLVVITPQEDGNLQLQKYQGRKAIKSASGGKVLLTIESDTTAEGLKATVEEFRAM